MPIYEVEIRRYKSNREESIIPIEADSPQDATEMVYSSIGELDLYSLALRVGITQGDYSVGKWFPVRIREQGGHWQ